MPAHDEAIRRRSTRKGKERGCWLYVPAETLEKIGRNDPEPPDYRMWVGRSGSLCVTFYQHRNGRTHVED